MSKKMLTSIRDELLTELKIAVGHKMVFPRRRIDDKDGQRAVNVYPFAGGMRFLGAASTVTDNDLVFQIDVYGRSSMQTESDGEAIMEHFKVNRLNFFDDPDKKWWRIGIRMILQREETGLYHAIFHLALSRCFV